jgi:DNA-binding NarL/FixJ family response regulator
MARSSLEKWRRSTAQVKDRVGNAALGNQRVDADRDTLAPAARATDRARGPLRCCDPNEAVEIWRELVAGRWSVVERFDSDGRRFVLAHKNHLSMPSACGLTRRQQEVLGYADLGRSNKFIAYELGISLSTVGVTLTKARAKLKGITGT